MSRQDSSRGTFPQHMNGGGRSGPASDAQLDPLDLVEALRSLHNDRSNMSQSMVLQRLQERTGRRWTIQEVRELANKQVFYQKPSATSLPKALRSSAAQGAGADDRHYAGAENLRGNKPLQRDASRRRNGDYAYAQHDNTRYNDYMDEYRFYREEAVEDPQWQARNNGFTAQLDSQWCQTPDPSSADVRAKLSQELWDMLQGSAGSDDTPPPPPPPPPMSYPMDEQLQHRNNRFHQQQVHQQQGYDYDNRQDIYDNRQEPGAGGAEQRALEAIQFVKDGRQQLQHVPPEQMQYQQLRRQPQQGAEAPGQWQQMPLGQMHYQANRQQQNNMQVAPGQWNVPAGSEAAYPSQLQLADHLGFKTANDEFPESPREGSPSLDLFGGQWQQWSTPEHHQPSQSSESTLTQQHFFYSPSQQQQGAGQAQASPWLPVPGTTTQTQLPAQQPPNQAQLWPQGLFATTLASSQPNLASSQPQQASQQQQQQQWSQTSHVNTGMPNQAAQSWQVQREMQQSMWPQGQAAAADIWGSAPGAHQMVPGQASQQQQAPVRAKSTETPDERSAFAVVMVPQSQTQFQHQAHSYFPVLPAEANAWHLDPNRRHDQRQPQPQETDANQALRLPSRFGRRRSQTNESDEAYVEDFTRMLFDQRLQESQSQGWPS